MTSLSPTLFQRNDSDVEALQWDCTPDCADLMYEWTMRRHGKMGAIWFVVLGEDDSYDVFGCLDDDLYALPDNKVDALLANGYTAAVYNSDNGVWEPIKSGYWVVKDRDGFLRTHTAEDFDSDYSPQ